MASLIGKYLCPCLPCRDMSSQRRSARSKVRALARKRHKNNRGPASASGAEDSVTITRNGSLTIFAISSGQPDCSDLNASCPDALRERIDLPGSVPPANDESDVAAKEPKPNLADGTRTLTGEALLRLPQPTKAYVSSVKMRRLMKEFKAVSKIAAGGLPAKESSGEHGDCQPRKCDAISPVDASGSKTSVETNSRALQQVQSTSKSDSRDKSEKLAKRKRKVSKDSNHDKEAAATGSSSSTVDSKQQSDGKDDEKGKEAIKKAVASGGFMSMETLTGPPYAVELVNDSLTEWNVKLYHIHPTSALAKDMKKHNIDHVLFNIAFPDDFPFSPPFVRVVSPHIEYGYVLDGGAICMELLTPQGWSSAYTIDAVILQLGATLVAGDGRIVQPGVRSDVPFNKQEAQESFRAIVETHERYGWHKVPGDNS
ncbi:uncharacterized protein [Diadema antillarum]|uniref:uncharacterized protein n=1 Tax=Diadema antillarum TaxID=105358 RepID=UPI003A8455C7